MTFILYSHLTYRSIEKLQLKHGLSNMQVNDKKSFYGGRRSNNTSLLSSGNHFEPGKGDLLFATAMGRRPTGLQRDGCCRRPLFITLKNGKVVCRAQPQ